MEKYGVLQDPKAIETRSCPRCGKSNARVETSTMVCPDCGARSGYYKKSDLPPTWDAPHGKEADKKANHKEGQG
jgi:endogenous inhibitor of DNA gyrase (YacG/DUF329 family)